MTFRAILLAELEEIRLQNSKLDTKLKPRYTSGYDACDNPGVPLEPAVAFDDRSRLKTRR